MITICQFKKFTKKSFNKFSKFVLMGNNIDGFVNVDIIEFENFEVVKSQLPNIIKNLKNEGEWDLKLYQIDTQLKIKHLYEYYRVPNKGKLILALSYMNMNEYNEITITDGLIHIFSYTSLYKNEKDINTGKLINGTVYEDYVTVMLFQELIKKTDVMEELKIENDRYFKSKHRLALKEFSNYAFE
jgi:hypothetical protein